MKRPDPRETGMQLVKAAIGIKIGLDERDGKQVMRELDAADLALKDVRVLMIAGLGEPR